MVGLWEGIGIGLNFKNRNGRIWDVGERNVSRMSPRFVALVTRYRWWCHLLEEWIGQPEYELSKVWYLECLGCHCIRQLGPPLRFSLSLHFSCLWPLVLTASAATETASSVWASELCFWSWPHCSEWNLDSSGSQKSPGEQYSHVEAFAQWTSGSLSSRRYEIDWSL